MLIDAMMPALGPVVLICNIMTIFFCLRPKRGLPFTICMLAFWVLSVHIFILASPDLNPLLVRAIGIVWIPAMLFLFKGQAFQIAFAMFLPYQLGALTTHLADALVGVTIGYQSPYALAAYVALSLIFLGVYITFILRYGRRLFERIFVEGKRGAWALYTIGIMFSFALIITMDWTAVGAALYFALILFILWGIGVLCYTIINTHEKAAQAHRTETLTLQMNAMRQRADAEKKHREDMAILRHDMRHEMGVIMELYRTGKAAEARAVYTSWQDTLQKAAPAPLCEEPILNAVFTRFQHRAEDKNIHLYVYSSIQAEPPVDTIQLSVMVASALENALNATDEIQAQDQRVVQVQLIQSGSQIGLAGAAVALYHFDETWVVAVAVESCGPFSGLELLLGDEHRTGGFLALRDLVQPFVGVNGCSHDQHRGDYDGEHLPVLLEPRFRAAEGVFDLCFRVLRSLGSLGFGRCALTFCHIFSGYFTKFRPQR